MKSNREKALSQASTSKPGKINLGPEANKILKRLERARNYNSKRKYNAELSKLSTQYPEFAASIQMLEWK